jgi:hypothetical protein
VGLHCTRISLISPLLLLLPSIFPVHAGPFVLTFCTDTGARLGCNPLRRTPWVTVRLACQQVYHLQYIHHEAFLDIYLFGIIVVFASFVFLDWCGGLLSILAPVFFGCLTLNVRSCQTQPCKTLRTKWQRAGAPKLRPPQPTLELQARMQAK